MDSKFSEEMRRMYESFYKQDEGDSIVAVVSEGIPGEYDDNPTVNDYEAKGYQLIDANIFGQGDESGEILIFKRSE